MPKGKPIGANGFTKKDIENSKKMNKRAKARAKRIIKNAKELVKKDKMKEKNRIQIKKKIIDAFMNSKFLVKNENNNSSRTRRS